jgi:hypothetical protein
MGYSVQERLRQERIKESADEVRIDMARQRLEDAVYQCGQVCKNPESSNRSVMEAMDMLAAVRAEFVTECEADAASSVREPLDKARGRTRRTHSRSPSLLKIWEMSMKFRKVERCSC